MADELDPRLESRLRDTLRREADAIPFTLRADTVRRVHDERRRSARAQRLSLLATAAVVVVALAALGVSMSMRSPQTVAQSPSPSVVSSALPSIDPAANATPDANGLMPYSALRGALTVNGYPSSTVQGEYLAAEQGDGQQSWTVGTVAASTEVGVAISCTGGRVVVGVVAGTQHLRSTVEPCETAYALIAIDGTLAGPGGAGSIVVQAMPSVRWRLVAGIRPPSSEASPSPRLSEPPTALASLPTGFELLAAAGQGAVQLQSLEGDAVPQDQVVRFAAAPHRGALAVAVACSDAGSVAFGFSDAGLPSTDPGGSDSPFTTLVTCDGTPQVVPAWNGWNAVDLTSGPQLGLSVKGGTAYRALLVDTSAVASDGEQTPVAGGLPTLEHMSAARSDVGQIIATHVRLRPAGDTGSEEQAADIRPSAAIRVVVACTGGTADLAVASPNVTIGNATSTQFAAIGSPVCDGTMQAFDWARTDGPSDAASVVVNAGPGTAWRVVVWDKTAGSHPKPTVPCGSAAALKAAPTPTLYAGGQPIGALPSYYTSSWGSVHDDGVPAIPTTTLEARAGIPLQLRMPHDICAGSWSVLYGTPAASGMGIDPVGALALLNEAPTTITSQENRIDLASLPPGDWVLRITLGFDMGYGTGLLRVHVTG